MKQSACFTRVVSPRQYGGYVRFVSVCKVLFCCPKNTQVQWFIVNCVTIFSLYYILSCIALYFNPAHKYTGCLKVFKISFHTPFLIKPQADYPLIAICCYWNLIIDLLYSIAKIQINITVVTINSKYKCEPQSFNKNSSKTSLYADVVFFLKINEYSEEKIEGL